MNTERFKFRVAQKQSDGTYKRYSTYSICWDAMGLYARVAIPKNDKEFLIEDIVIDGDNAILEQSTGLKDKNGNLIYEGAVVRFSYFDYNGKDYHMVGVIEYAMFGLMIKGVKGEHFEEFTGYEEGAGKAYLQCWLGEFDFDPDCDFEIIGNIHDNEVAE